jgi:mono/diheme cytochrome c family protein
MVALLALAPAQVFGQDAERGKQLYETHCGSCHYERLHQRERAKSKIRTLSDLRDEVTRWAPQTRRRFTFDEIEDMVQYLNRTYYRMDK